MKSEMSKSAAEIREYKRAYREANREHRNALDRQRYREKNVKNHGLGEEWMSTKEAKMYWDCESWELDKWRKEGLLC